MAINPTVPFNGATTNGLTSPTYTTAVDTPPVPNAKQWAVTALGGTQTSVQTTLSSMPFTIAMFKPSSTKTNSKDSSGRVTSAPVNVYKAVIRKGLALDSLGTVRIGLATISFEIPAGAEVYDLPNVRALISAAIGFVTDQSSNIGEAIRTGNI